MRVGRIVTPFDSFMDGFSVWMNGMWFLWIVVALAVAAVIVLVNVSKSRARARARVPQYRRRDS